MPHGLWPHPDLSGIDEDPLACIQALSLVSSISSVNRHEKSSFSTCESKPLSSKYLSDNGITIGQALRGCIIEGIHRHVPEEICGPELSRRCRTIFWVVYMLNLEFSA